MDLCCFPAISVLFGIIKICFYKWLTTMAKAKYTPNYLIVRKYTFLFALI